MIGSLEASTAGEGDRQALRARHLRDMAVANENTESAWRFKWNPKRTLPMTRLARIARMAQMSRMSTLLFIHTHTHVRV